MGGYGRQPQDSGRREDDLGMKLGPLEVKANGRTVTTMVMWMVVGGFLFYHHYLTDQVEREMAKALWVQNWILAHPEKERKAVLGKLPPDVRQKILQQGELETP